MTKKFTYLIFLLLFTFCSKLTKKIVKGSRKGSCEASINASEGELVNEFRHSSPESAFEYWNLRNQNNQEVAPGLYFFTIEDLTGNNTEPYIGKFVIIR